ncbi:MAG: bifunctional [glutamine synthetase] adenylyltransferase/[glutamine synthetase]-adenylyl-L-tyrosine phosphorylase, partial [Actinomycetes bacterium]
AQPGAPADDPPAGPPLLDRLAQDAELRDRLCGVLGASDALAEHLVRHPGAWRVLADETPTGGRTADALREAMLRAVGADPGRGSSGAPPCAPSADSAVLDALRIAYRDALLGLAARDLSGALPLHEAAAELADLAAAALEAALAVARAEVPDASSCRLAVIGMGKCGGRELNYVSDVDVVFVAEAADGVDEQQALATASQLASALMRICSTTTAEGSLWQVDAGLRPEGRNGPLVRTVASHVAYYERWAKTWEFQALLKARFVAGDASLGARYVEAVAPLVWHAADRDHFVEDVRAMRRRVEDHVPAREAERQLKLGPGGLRDVEFAVQLLQLVHGRADPTLRAAGTLDTLASLSRSGYVGREDAAVLDEAYRFLRALEHRIQLYRLRRTHVVPESDEDLRRLGRSLGFRTDPVRELTTAWRRHAREVRRLHEKLFYRPLLLAVARLDATEARLTPEAARERLVALGYDDPGGALRHLEALTSGVSRRAAIQRTLLPVMLGWFADAADPDAGLLGFRRVSDALGTTHWYLRLLRDSAAAAERLARLLASSRLATDLLMRAPEGVKLLADDESLRPRPVEALDGEIRAATRRNADDPAAAVAAARAVRRREMFRVAAGDVLDVLEVDEIGEALTAVAASTVRGALDVATRVVAAQRGGPLPGRFAVIAMGRFGGCELGYSSDADVLFVYDPEESAETEAAAAAMAVAGELRRLLSLPAPDPPLTVDADLRPEGRGGPLVRSLASYAAYYKRWSHVWESQALLRAEPVAGDESLGRDFVAAVAPVRYPANGLDTSAVREIRRIKARIEAERLPRGADPTTHTKLGRGGLADVEWTVQLIQLQHAHAVPGLRTTHTMTAMGAAVDAGLLDPDDAAVLGTAWRTAARLRNALMLVRGKATDSLPSNLRELAGAARLVGYPDGGTGALVEDYRRVTRRARGVVERVFYA